MTDRYENIRLALEMGPTPGLRRAVEQSVIGPQDLSILFAKVTFSVGINGSHSVPIEEAIANAALAAACDPDTIRELLAERDQLAAALEAAREDAERYRWLRTMAREQLLNPKAAGTEYCPDMRTYWRIPTLLCNGLVGGFMPFDAAIDRARGSPLDELRAAFAAKQQGGAE